MAAHCLNTNKYNVPAPAQAQGDGIGLFVKATMVQLHAVIVKVRRVDQLRVALRRVILQATDHQ